MASSDDDEDLKRAIAMSLSESKPSPSTVVDLVDSEDDEEMRQAIALSLQTGERNGESAASASSHKSPTSLQNGCASLPPEDSPSAQQLLELGPNRSMTDKPLTGLLGLDRKAMERERLARLGKRKRSVSPGRPSKLVTKPLVLHPASSEGKQRANSKESPIQYPHGAIKRTWAFKHPRTDDIKIEEVFQASTASIAVLSAFQSDDQWVFSKLRPSEIKQIWIMSAKGEDVQEKLLGEVQESRIPNLRLHFPPMEGNVQHVHSKLMLLVHPTHLRIVVPTANLIKVDWGETNTNAKGESWQAAVLENSVFLVDLPRRADGKLGNKKGLTPFGQELMEFLEAQELGRTIIDGILKFDFSGTGSIALVHSIPGKDTESFANRTGLPGLAKAVRRLGLDNVKEIELDYAASSLGAIKESFLMQLYRASCGHASMTSSKVPHDFLDRIRIYFPTKDYVVKSTGGPNCGGIITLNRKDYNDSFPKQCMREYKSSRPGVLSHNKILLARGRKKDGTPFAWAYVGSANLSESAWGSQKMLKSGKDGKLTIRNWECGIVVPVPDGSFKGMKLEDGEVPSMSVFKGTVEVPFQYPGGRYEGKEPWFFRDYD